MPNVQYGVAIRRTGHSNAEVKGLYKLCEGFAALRVFVLKGCKLVDANCVKARQQLLVLKEPLNRVVISNNNLSVRLKRLLTIFSIGK